MRPRQKRNTRGSGATNPRKLAGDLAQPEFGAATFSECGRGRMGGVICSRAGVLSEGRTQDLTRYFQSLDTDSCELIAIDHPRRAIFAQPTAFIIVIPMTHLPVFFGRRFCITVDRGCASSRKSAKVLSMPNCGMRVAMDIGVIRDHVSSFYRYFGTPVTMFGSESMYKGTAAPLVRCAVAKGRGALDEFVSEFGFGRRQPRDSGATNLPRGSLIKARCRLVSWE